MAKRINVMVSSSVRGNEQLLERISAILSTDYNVWMSHEGTVFVNSRVSNFANCLTAVAECDVFLGIITGYYGSGRAQRSAPSITHLEMRKAVELNKLRHLFAHKSIEVARELLKPYRLPPEKGPFHKVNKRRYDLIEWPRNGIISDLQVLDLYDEMMRLDIKDVDARTGNWVQPYANDEAILKSISAQFEDVKRIRKLVRESKLITSNPVNTHE